MRYLILVSFLIFFYTQDLSAKIFDTMGTNTQMPKCIRYDADLAYIFIPECKEWLTTAGMRAYYSYNKMGLRDKNYSQRPTQNTARILMIGSSKLAGPGISEKDSIPRVMEKKLKRNYSKTEVINGSVQGYRPIHIAIFIKKLIEAYHPTHVIYLTSFTKDGSSMQNIVLELELERDSMGNPKKLGIDIFGIEYWLHNYANFIYRKFMTLIYTGYWAYKSIQCKTLSRNEKELTNCLFKFNAEMLLYVQKIVELSGAKFSLLLADEDFSNNLKIQPHWNKKIAHFVDNFVPEILIENKYLENFLRVSGINTIKITTSDLEALEDQIHLTKEGSSKMAARIIKTLAPMWFLPN